MLTDWIARQIRGAPTQALPRDLIADAQVCASRSDLILHMPRRGRVGLLGAPDLAEEITAISAPLELLVLERDLAEWSQSASFDWLYLDAPDMSAAMRGAARLLKPGGYLIAHAFADKRRAAIVNFMCEARWPLAWWAFDADARYDVALRKPE